jgi:5-methylcytosine-specific restriction endonuclease McrA
MPTPSIYRSPRWRAERAEFLRHHPLCSVPGCRVAATNVDHDKTVRGGADFWDQINWVGLCQSHHSQKTNRFDGGFGRAVKEKGNERLIVRGCNPDGTPKDPLHHWNKPRSKP